MQIAFILPPRTRKPAPGAKVPATFAALCTCAVLSACTASTTILESPTAGPGPRFMSSFDAGVIFADTCLTRGAGFEDALEGLRVHNMTRNTETGTYYHNTKNLSVRITDKTCSLVFASNEDAPSTISGLAQGSVSILPQLPKDIDISSREGEDGLPYVRLAIDAPVGGQS